MKEIINVVIHKHGDWSKATRGVLKRTGFSILIVSYRSHIYLNGSFKIVSLNASLNISRFKEVTTIL